MTMTRLPARHPQFRNLACLFATIVALTFRASAAVPPPEKLLPDDTLLLLTVPDCSKMREVSKTQPQMQMWNDPALTPFRDKLISKLKQELVLPLEHDLGIKFDDYTSLPQGQLTLALIQNGWHGTTDPMPAVLVLMDAREKSAQLKKNLADLRKKWVDAGKPLKTKKIRDQEFWFLALSTNDVPKSLKNLFSDSGSQSESGDDAGKKKESKDELIIGQVESLLIIGNSAPAVEKVVARMTGGSAPSLSDQADFEANRLALFRESPCYGWMNAKALISPLSVKPPAQDEETPNPFATMFSPDKIITATGLGALKTVAFAMQYSNEGSTLQIFAGVPEANRTGLFKILSTEPKDSSPPAFVPADAVKFQRWRIDGQQAWNTLQSVLNDISPQISASVNFLLETANGAAREKDPDFDIRKNLFGNLGDDLIGYEKNPRGQTSAELRDPPALFLIGSPRPEQLAAALKNLLVLAGQQLGEPTEREFLGRKIYSVKLPPLPMAPMSANDSPQSRLLSYAASSGYLALSTDVATLEEFLRSSDSQQKPLRESTGFADAMAQIGGGRALMFAYENQVETARLAVDLLRQNASKTNDAAGGLSGPYAIPFDNDGSFKDWVDFSLLPPFEKIARYFYLSVFSLNANADGLTAKIFTPTPPQLKK